MTASASARILASTVFCIGLSFPIQSQTGKPARSPLQQLRSSEWAERAEAFEAIQKQPPGFQAPGMATELVELLKRENAFIQSAIREARGRYGVSDRYGEELGEYHAEVLGACLKYCDREGLLGVLLDEARPGSLMRPDAFGLLAQTLTSGFSEEQQDRMVAAIASGARDPLGVGNRLFSLGAIEDILERRVGVSSHALEEMHRATLSAIADPRLAMRLKAVETIGKFRDARDRALLTRIAATDTLETVSKGRTAYPVREAATKAIAGMPR
jgi:hypothetical protein